MKKITLLLTLIALAGCSFSEGQRAGQIVKLSKKGIIFKTYEGELATLSHARVGTMVNNVFSFSIKNEAIFKQVSQAMDSGANVSLTYEQEFFTFPWEADTTYIITKVDVIYTVIGADNDEE